MLPRRSRGLPPVMAVAREAPIDTGIEETIGPIPPGDTHLWAKIRKLDLTTSQAREALARAVDVGPGTWKHAGARDRHSDCRQWFSVPVAEVEHPQALANAGRRRQLKVVEVREAGRELRPGDATGLDVRCHLLGGADDYPRAREILALLRRSGAPNYFAAGNRDRGAVRLGRLLAEGRPLPGGVATNRRERTRLLRGFQQHLFDAFCAARFEDDALDRPLPGDVIETGCHRPPYERGREICEDPEHVRARIEAGESRILGPLFGDGMPVADGPAREREEEFLRDQGVRPRCLDELRGGRRPVSFRPTRSKVTVEGGDLVLTCHLPCEVAVAVLCEEFVRPEGRLR